MKTSNQKKIKLTNAWNDWKYEQKSLMGLFFFTHPMNSWEPYKFSNSLFFVFNWFI